MHSNREIETGYLKGLELFKNFVQTCINFKLFRLCADDVWTDLKIYCSCYCLQSYRGQDMNLTLFPHLTLTV